MYARWCWSHGGWRLDWPAYFSFLRQVCGLELPGDLWAREAALARAEAAAGWWWPHRRFVMVCERPASCTWSGPTPVASPGSITPTDNFGDTLPVDLQRRRSAQRSVVCRQLPQR